MRSSVRNLLGGTLAVAALLAGSVGGANAQTVPAGETARINFDAATAVASTQAVFAPKLRADFQAQQPQLGPDREDQGIGVGVLAMITRNSFSTEDFIDIDSRTGLGFGFWVGGNRNGTVGFTGEFIFLNQKYGEGEFEGSRKIFQIPAVFHVNFGSRSRNSVGGYVVLGPSVAFELKESFTGGFGADNFGGVDIGLIAGVGVEVYRIGIEGRMNFGMRNISEEGDVSKIKTRQFELLGKFAFN